VVDEILNIKLEEVWNKLLPPGGLGYRKRVELARKYFIDGLTPVEQTIRGGGEKQVSENGDKKTTTI
jgi:hypothetical protein